MNRNIVTIVVCVLLFIAFLIIFRGCNDLKMSRDASIIMASRSQEKLVITENKLGQETASKSVLEGTLSELKLIDISKDSTLRTLQQKVDRLTASLSVFTTNTHDNHTSSTEVIVSSGDTASVVIYPEYRTKDTIVTPWLRYHVVANKDSITVDIVSINSFEVKQEYRKSSIFKKSDLELQITNKNPHTKTIDAQSFHIPMNKGGRGYYFGGGILLGLILAALL